MSLSARRAWIEMLNNDLANIELTVALRKESVDRNTKAGNKISGNQGSLSARRAWIEMIEDWANSSYKNCRSPQGERG